MEVTSFPQKHILQIFQIPSRDQKRKEITKIKKIKTLNQNIRKQMMETNEEEKNFPK